MKLFNKGRLEAMLAVWRADHYLVQTYTGCHMAYRTDNGLYFVRFCIKKLGQLNYQMSKEEKRRHKK